MDRDKGFSYFMVIDVLLFSLQVGPDGAGHFVKMVHNGIEYGDMQLICESYHLMKDVLGMNQDEMAQVSLVSRLETSL